MHKKKRKYKNLKIELGGMRSEWKNNKLYSRNFKGTG